ncbi:class I SAM-dependent methyltransferase [Candidatus Thorarchaeota archaeon]|nr:MAG: class I SAM-dependent methyltransferase [Candidatus Thorarchaeota archaeon]
MVNRYRDQWEDNADAFTDLIAGRGTPHHRNILNPCVEELIGDVEGKTLLDAGCGEGYLSRYYAKRGAVVTAIDFSRRLIEIAMKFMTEDGQIIEYMVADICHMKSIENEKFDVVLSNLVLLNIPCLKEAFNEFHRVLKVEGYLVFSIVHPAFNFYGPSSWEMGEKDSETGRRDGLFFKVDHYFEEREYERYWKTRKGEDFPATISFFHRTLETYLNTMVKSGFELVDFKEPRPTNDNPFFNRERRIPFFAVFKARKILSDCA